MAFVAGWFTTITGGFMLEQEQLRREEEKQRLDKAKAKKAKDDLDKLLPNPREDIK